ncbi:hypothetical protein LCGC14_0527090 [marine sediment metagenome]|uniref:Uncharacterized protein n=1 Tax=marine sediment metagenome TaxID=412755 RepID=A0A0F9RWX7_9ZZZZ
MNTKDLIAKCGKLKSNWNTRDRKIREWYSVLRLTDELKQEGMESVTSNDPRTGYNLGKHLMTSSLVADKIDQEDLSPQEVEATSYLEGYVAKRWAGEERRYRRMGRQSFKGELIGLMLATGWYSVFSMVEKDKIWSEVWNPIEVYPAFGPAEVGLTEVAHIYTMKSSIANRKAKLMGWKIEKPFTGNTTLYDYHGFDDDGDVVNGIVLGGNQVVPLEKNPVLSKLGMLPLFISPIGGLPDRGAIDSRWQEHFGESIVATNEELTKNYNRMLTFSQQLMRDTANPRWFERSSGDTTILKEEDLFKRGAIFRGAPGEDVTPLAVPPIPVELRTMLFDYQNMLQRGLFPWAIFGNIQMQMSYLAMANIASAALQVLTPYMDALRGLRSDVDDYWVKLLMATKYKPHKFIVPSNMPEEVEFDVQADIEIPGYLVQRATVARMLDPSFRLSTDTVMDKMFPEVRDPLREQAKVRKDDAMNSPEAIAADQVLAYKEQARLLREKDDPASIEAAELYEKVAAMVEARLSPQQSAIEQAGAAQRAVPPAEEAIMREVFPTKEATAPQEGLGRV